jgi:hypothetical protein
MVRSFTFIPFIWADIKKLSIFIHCSMVKTEKPSYSKTNISIYFNLSE